MVRNRGVASLPHHKSSPRGHRKLFHKQPPSCTRCDKHIQPSVPSRRDTARGPRSQVTLQPPPTGSSLSPCPWGGPALQAGGSGSLCSLPAWQPR